MKEKSWSCRTRKVKQKSEILKACFSGSVKISLSSGLHVMDWRDSCCLQDTLNKRQNYSILPQAVSSTTSHFPHILCPSLKRTYHPDFHNPPPVQRVSSGTAVYIPPPIPEGPALRWDQRAKRDIWKLSDLRTFAKTCQADHRWSKSSKPTIPYDTTLACAHFSYCLSRHSHVKGITICPLKHPCQLLDPVTQRWARII